MYQDLKKPAELNIPGICQFWFIPESHLAFFSIKFMDNLEVKYWELKPGMKWLKGYHNNEVTEIETNEKQTEAGCIYESQANLFLPTDNEEMRYQLTRLEQERMIVMIKETSGTVKIIGDKISACRIQYKFVNKLTKKGYDVVFLCENTNPPYIYKGILPQ